MLLVQLQAAHLCHLLLQVISCCSGIHAIILHTTSCCCSGSSYTHTAVKSCSPVHRCSVTKSHFHAAAWPFALQVEPFQQLDLAEQRRKRELAEMTAAAAKQGTSAEVSWQRLQQQKQQQCKADRQR
jgi:hypothetical protein